MHLESSKVLFPWVITCNSLTVILNQVRKITATEMPSNPRINPEIITIKLIPDCIKLWCKVDIKHI